MKAINYLLILVAVFSLGACTWVEVSPQGEDVRVLEPERVSGCERVGKTTVNTAATVAGLKRHKVKVQDELDTLARNSAAEIGGDTVVRVGEPVDGRQVYEVYRCIPAGSAE